MLLFIYDLIECDDYVPMPIIATIQELNDGVVRDNLRNCKDNMGCNW